HTQRRQGARDLPGERQLRVEAGAVELAAGQRVLGHDRERNREPARTPVEGPAALAVRKVTEHGALVGCLREVLEVAAAAKAAERDDLAGARDGGEPCHL